ncbi:MAG TPA: hypothetical protein VIK01_07240 [Polyangiaceae bacterium]
MIDWLERVGKGITQYRPGWAIGVPACLFALGGWLVMLSSHQPGLLGLLALASTCIGVLLGFLFGIPRVNDGATPNGSSAPSLKVNTNIEQISDWLTKILVGLTLTNLGNLPKLFAQLAAYLSAHGMSGSGSDALIVSVSVFFLVDGFLFGYLATRLYLTGAFLAADPTELLNSLRPVIADISVDAEGNADLPPDAKAAAKTVAQMDRRQLSGADDLAMWAKAQLGSGNAKQAVVGYAEAVRVAPERADLRVEQASALKKAGEPRDRILRALEAAYVSATQDPRAKRRAAEGLILNYLYLPPPTGYSRAIELGEGYTAQKLPFSAQLYLYLGAAYGQKYAYEQGVPEDTRNATRSQALENLKQAVALDATLSGLIASMLDGEHGDDDLVSFKNDPEFRALAEPAGGR